VAASAGVDAATPAVVVPLSTGVKEATNIEGEDDDEEEEGQTRPVTSTIAGLAKEAAQLFHSRSYQGCLLILNQLLVQNETDPKVYQFKNSSCLVALLLLRCLVVSYDKCFFSILFRLRSCNAMPVVTLSLISSLPRMSEAVRTQTFCELTIVFLGEVNARFQRCCVHDNSSVFFSFVFF